MKRRITFEDKGVERNASQDTNGCGFDWRACAAAAAKLKDPAELFQLLSNDSDGITAAFERVDAHHRECTADGASLLVVACRRGHLEMVKAMLSWGANPNPLCTFDGRNTALIGAVLSPRENALAILDMLLCADAQPVPAAFVDLYLMEIITQRCDDAGELVRRLLELLKLRIDKDHQTGLVALACKHGKADCLSAMLEVWSLWDGKMEVFEKYPFETIIMAPTEDVSCLQMLVKWSFHASTTMTHEQKNDAMVEALVRCIDHAAVMRNEPLCREALSIAAKDDVLDRVAKANVEDAENPTSVLLHIAQQGMTECVGLILEDKKVVSWANQIVAVTTEYKPDIHDSGAFHLTLLVQACLRLVPAPVVELMLQAGLSNCSYPLENGRDVDALTAACHGRTDEPWVSAGEVVSVLLQTDKIKKGLGKMDRSLNQSPLVLASERYDVGCLRALATGGALEVNQVPSCTNQVCAAAYVIATFDGGGGAPAERVQRRREFYAWMMRFDLPLPAGPADRERITTCFLESSDVETLRLLATKGLTPPRTDNSLLATHARRWRHEHLNKVWRDAVLTRSICSWLLRTWGERVCAPGGSMRLAHQKEYEQEQ